jgi:hypothetical protein
MVDLHQPMVASFSTSLSTDLTLQSGPIAFVSQSGAMGMAVFTQAQAEGIAVGKFISTGNEAVLDFTDFLEYFIEDPNVKLILGYIEGVRDGRRFVNAARKARAAGKFVAILKVGKSKAGERASQSHTGALAGASHIYEAAFRRGGILSVNDIRSLTDIAALAPDQGTVNGPGVGIVSMLVGSKPTLQCNSAIVCTNPKSASCNNHSPPSGHSTASSGNNHSHTASCEFQPGNASTKRPPLSSGSIHLIHRGSFDSIGPR